MILGHWPIGLNHSFLPNHNLKYHHLMSIFSFLFDRHFYNDKCFVSFVIFQISMSVLQPHVIMVVSALMGSTDMYVIVCQDLLDSNVQQVSVQQALYFCHYQVKKTINELLHLKLTFHVEGFTKRFHSEKLKPSSSGRFGIFFHGESVKLTLSVEGLAKLFHSENVKVWQKSFTVRV